MTQDIIKADRVTGQELLEDLYSKFPIKQINHLATNTRTEEIFRQVGIAEVISYLQRRYV